MCSLHAAPPMAMHALSGHFRYIDRFIQLRLLDTSVSGSLKSEYNRTQKMHCVREKSKLCQELESTKIDKNFDDSITNCPLVIFSLNKRL